MKRWLIFFFILLFIHTEVFAIEILPTMGSRTNTQDRVWSGAFQVAWNDLITWFVHEKVRFTTQNPESVLDLNNQNFIMNDMPEENCYKHTSKILKRTKRQINKAIKKKFEISSNLLTTTNLTARNDKILVYGMLNKNIEFVTKFDELGVSTFGIDQSANYYGITPKSKNGIRYGAKVLFYHSPEDYAVELLTTSNDNVFLYKNNANKDFETMYYEMCKKIQKYYGDPQISEVDELKIPHLQFVQEKLFEEMNGKHIKGKNLVIDNALETICFQMDNIGGKNKKNNTMLNYEVASLVLPKPRLLYFDDNFIIFVKMKGEHKPYFALRVHDISNYQKNVVN